MYYLFRFCLWGALCVSVHTRVHSSYTQGCSFICFPLSLPFCLETGFLTKLEAPFWAGWLARETQVHLPLLPNARVPRQCVCICLCSLMLGFQDDVSDFLQGLWGFELRFFGLQNRHSYPLSHLPAPRLYHLETLFVYKSDSVYHFIPRAHSPCRRFNWDGMFFPEHKNWACDQGGMDVLFRKACHGKGEEASL